MDTTWAVSYILGVLSTIIIRALFVGITQRTAELDNLADAVSSIEELSFVYWLAPGKEEPEDEAVAASRLRAAITGTMAYRGTAKSALSGYYWNYKRLDDQLFDIALGGDFERAGRSADPSTAMAVSEICHKMAALIRKARKSTLWLL